MCVKEIMPTAYLVDKSENDLLSPHPCSINSLYSVCFSFDLPVKREAEDGDEEARVCMCVGVAPPTMFWTQRLVTHGAHSICCDQ